MVYKIRKLEIENNGQAFKEFSKIGATVRGQRIMAKKIFPLALKVKDVDVKASNILKQEMLARNGDVVTSRNTLLRNEGLTDIIILGTIDSFKGLIEKIRHQPFGLKNLSILISDYLNNLKKNNEKKILNIANRQFDLKKEGALIMGILNVTPDSFYDGGFYVNPEIMKRRITMIAEEGAHIIDIGGLSTRPGSKPVPVEDEIKRVIPAINYAKKNYDIIISVDTYRSEVAKYAVDAGADIINDISGFTFDEKIIDTVAKLNAWVVIMHIKGSPETMQKNPQYDDVIDEIYDFLYVQADKAIQKGVEKNRIIIDPGIGFGKNLKHNLEIISKIREFKNMFFPVLLGVSRKSFIGNLLDSQPPSERLTGSLSAAVCGFLNGADILRVHDVKQTKEAIRIAGSINNYS